MGYTLSDVVNELLVEQGEAQTNKFARYYQLGVAGYRKFNMNTSGVPKVIELTINANDTADLPSDYLQYTRIALCVNGSLYCLGRNDTLCLNKIYDDCGNKVGHTVIREGISVTNNSYINGEFKGGLFGIGSDNNCLGYYRIDREANQIQFSQLAYTSSLVLEYIADINAVDGDFDIHPFCVEALKDYIFWKYKQRSSRPLGEQQLAKADFNESQRIMRACFASSTKEEWIAAFQSGNKATPKM